MLRFVSPLSLSRSRSTVPSVHTHLLPDTAMVLSSRASIRSSRSRKSEFEYGSEFGDDDYSVDDDEVSTHVSTDPPTRRRSC